ncbi:hypothetical protein EIP91_003406 [Steccherinum ochraceum]|uniref:BTB domain-containing protein n=1 Tax=Steccherinum ochraceum TaxID=92696 RepID=A0A4R0RM90_9APHY|nr:hypothetical protein EIP91_003406 [Steccherinum ochraceum]
MTDDDDRFEFSADQDQPPTDDGAVTTPTSPAPYSIVVSTTFHPAFAFRDLLPDAIFLSSDALYFFVHRAHLLASSTNNFAYLFVQQLSFPNSSTTPPVFLVSEHSALMDVVLHAIYGMSCAELNPSLSTLLDAISALDAYGTLHRVLTPSSPLCLLILTEAPRDPLQVYAVAARHRLDHLAVAVSAKLHSIQLADVPAAAALAMGPIYLKRLFLLHYRRVEYLKLLLNTAPETHVETLACGFVQQTDLQTAWSLATGSLMWDARPDLSIGRLRWTLASLLDKLECEQCKTALSIKIRQMVLNWCEAKATI